MTNQELIDKINEVSNIIHEKALRGSANYIIISPKIADILENLDIKKHRKKKLEAILNSQNKNPE